MIPKLVKLRGSPFRVLPPGVHRAEIGEVEERFGTNFQRKVICGGFTKACSQLRTAGCKEIYLNGSFVTENPMPNDFDAAWETSGVLENLLNPVLLDAGSDAQRGEFWGELYPVTASIEASMEIVRFFQVEKFTGRPKGILKIGLQV